MSWLDDLEKRSEERKRRNTMFWGGIPASFWFLLIVLAGLFGTAFGIYPLREYVASRNWRTATGTITASAVETIQHEETSRGSTIRWNTYAAKIAYSYQVNGQSYTGSRVEFDAQFCLLGECMRTLRNSEKPDAPQETVNRYPVNSAVTVYYSPGNPASAVLERKVRWVVWVVLIFGMASLIIGLTLLVNHFLHQTHPPKRPIVDVSRLE